MSEILKTGKSRVWLWPSGSAPDEAARYMGLARVTGLDYSLGDISPVRKPSPSQYGQYQVIDTIRGEPDLPGLSIEAYKEPDIASMLLLAAQKGCNIDMQVHFGECERPDDFNAWRLITVLEEAPPTNYSTTDLGALSPTDEAAIKETLALVGQRVYEVTRVNPTVQDSAGITERIVDVLICDSATCASCGLSSDGCQVAFALRTAPTGSPGLQAELGYTQNGGQTWGATHITTLGLAEAPSAMACVGSYLVVVSNASGSLHYARITEILDGSETWTEVTTGFVTGGEPNAIVAVDSTHVWIAGDGGYIYFTSDPTSGVEVQTDGSVTSQDLAAITMLDQNNGYAVGASNAMLRTANGGGSWQAVTGPAVGIALNCVALRGVADEVFVGTAGGELYYSQDRGSNWTLKGFPGSGAGQVRDIVFATRMVGYMAHSTATPAGRVLRTVDGGNSWYILPEEAGATLPVNDYVSTLAACRDNPNVAFGGGLADNGTDGFLVKFD